MFRNLRSICGQKPCAMLLSEIRSILGQKPSHHFFDLSVSGLPLMFLLWFLNILTSVFQKSLQGAAPQVASGYRCLRTSAAWKTAQFLWILWVDEVFYYHIVYGGFHEWGTPSYHPIIWDFHGFSLINQPFGGTPICGTPQTIIVYWCINIRFWWMSWMITIQYNVASTIVKAPHYKIRNNQLEIWTLPQGFW